MKKLLSGRSKQMQWLATAMLFSGALLISIKPEAGATMLPFVVFTIGHIIYSIDSILTKHYPYLALNASFLALDISAIIIRI